jgi:hypothetical protein
MVDLHFQFILVLSAITALIIPHVCQPAWWIMKYSCFPLFTQEQFLEMADFLEEQTNFSNFIGARDQVTVTVFTALSDFLCWQYVIQTTSFFTSL